jgi:hypothetical protein
LTAGKIRLITQPWASGRQWNRAQSIAPFAGLFNKHKAIIANAPSFDYKRSAIYSNQRDFLSLSSSALHQVGRSQYSRPELFSVLIYSPSTMNCRHDLRSRIGARGKG